MNGPRLAEADQNELDGLVKEIVFLLGLRSADADATAKQLLHMTAYLRKRYHQTPTAEIRRAYQLYVEGELGLEPIRIFDAISLNQIMRAYWKHRGKILHPLIEGQKLLPSAERPEPTPDQIEAIMRQSLEDAYQRLRAKETVTDHGNAIYEWLDAKGLIPFTPERKQAIFKQALTALQQHHAWSAATTRHNPTGRAEARRLADVFKKTQLADGPPLTGEPLEEARRYAKQLAFILLLAEWIDAGVKPAEVLDQPPPAGAEPLPDGGVS
ncbi:PASTA domain-containing protein [Spirosoma sordidisoli]|nr:PASTA domain-containing protein [Spirosoma sordidisoli]